MTTSPQDDLTAERAAAVIDKVKAELPGVWLGGRQRMVLEQVIAEALKTARQEALIDVMRLHKEWRAGKHSGLFSDLLDRLASEGG